MKTYILNKNDALTEDQLQELQQAKLMPSIPDEDCPEYSYEKLNEMLKNSREKCSLIMDKLRER